MHNTIDWISFTCSGGDPDPTQNNPAWSIALEGIRKLCPGLVKMIEGEGSIIDGNGRAPFKASIRNQEVGVSIFFGHKRNLVLVEISGHGCETLRKFNGELSVLNRCKDRITRIDIACDWKTETRPTEFASSINSNRFKSSGVLHSESGETVYIGSRTSDRYARVYRYNAPHPRHELLRCEMVLRDEQAKACATNILEDGLFPTAKALGNAFGWSHELWLGESGGEEKLKAWRPDNRGSGTVRWLYTQVSPALERLMVEGHKQTVREWFAKMHKMVYDEYGVDDTTPI